MAANTNPGLQIRATEQCISASCNISNLSSISFSFERKRKSCTDFRGSSYISLSKPIDSSKLAPIKFEKMVTKAMSGAREQVPVSGLPIDLRGKRAFIAGIADDNGYGWAIAKSLAAAGAEILVGTWVPALNIFETSLRRGKFDDSRVLPDGSLMEITKVYPLDAVFDSPEDVPEDVKTNKRYAGSSKWTVKEVAECVKQDFGTIDILVHSLANGPEVSKPLSETSRKGYLAAVSASSYSFISLLRHFLPIINPGGATISLTYVASERIIPGYGGGMSSAKAALESDTRVLAFEAGRKHKVRVNTISAGPLGSRAAKAIGFIDMMINYSLENAPLQKELYAEEVGNTAAFLASPLASAITGATVYVDNGLNAMGVGVDSPAFSGLNIPTDNKS
ncbi:enoyl-[acyl-carrier-protein] reductase [NADH] 2, chloroplastic-like isoform X2 [Nicotiana sylvestris]|uniref:Enoyl-[acyl-carrier-protein] reductase [NADH], chloroplastic n=2 Tax=Nicotiana sylvestris TaxID=4096 RepID=A0A1U7VLC9_NICSY|nr:PREDICTED: enoyl-[acyl-carrier-protein] reductase [NADH] 2, chloroplastic-like [Nicotiana sylvestris]XP_009767164.1 PREDICTED: enoyl-[acyl-carrier-protein] reductase [NADH] 2, chloroplastic-like [Nicotiana sylvestris]XP_009767165.1 PREDICTED: enoyl-[acyl-carrier-protein] reductase [NADH] 2, chloroplastic-like [Nicotiana sylvestris]